MLRRRDLLAALPSGALAMLGCRSETPPRGEPASSAPAPEARDVLSVVAASTTKDGAGVKLSRTLGGKGLPLLDPFLLLDEIHSDDPRDFQAGFPRHPHRGFETVTYMIDGAIEHRDSVGNHGRLEGGAIQWMTAGRGILHSEMPDASVGRIFGLQLWVNLPKRLKWTEPRYQDIGPANVPELSAEGGVVRVAAGSAFGSRGPVEGIAVAPTMLDVTVPPGATFTLELPATQAAFAYLLEGALELGASRRRVARRELAVLGGGATIVARAASEQGRMLILAADPIGEPVARRGPFVMNTEAELDQAFDDYRNGRIG